MALFQDQLYNLSTTEADIKAAMAVAEAKALQAEQRRQEAELQRRQAEARWKVAKQQLEQTQTEVETLRCRRLQAALLLSLSPSCSCTLAAEAVQCYYLSRAGRHAGIDVDIQFSVQRFDAASHTWCMSHHWCPGVESPANFILP